MKLPMAPPSSRPRAIVSSHAFADALARLVHDDAPRSRPCWTAQGARPSRRRGRRCRLCCTTWRCARSRRSPAVGCAVPASGCNGADAKLASIHSLLAWSAMTTTDRQRPRRAASGAAARSTSVNAARPGASDADLHLTAAQHHAALARSHRSGGVVAGSGRRACRRRRAVEMWLERREDHPTRRQPQVDQRRRAPGRPACAGPARRGSARARRPRRAARRRAPCR